MSENARDFYEGLLEWSAGDTSFLCRVWAWGSHPGEAIYRMLDCARQNKITDPYISEIDPVDFDGPPESAITNDDGVSFIADTEHSFPKEYVYRLPHGVVLSEQEGEVEPEDIRPGYEVSEDDDGLIEIFAVVEETDLTETYFSLFGAVDDIRGLMIKIAGDWEDSENDPEDGEIYLNEELDSVSGIRDYIAKNEIDILLNGHVTVSAYSDEGATNININDHKVLCVMTYEKRVCDEACRILNERGLLRKDPLVSVAGGIHHWHYRHPEGAGRKDLIDKLISQGFSFWKPDPDRRYQEER